MDLLQPLLSLGPAALYLLLFALVFAESAAFLGVFVPGEVALLTAAALTVTGRIGIVEVVAVAATAAVLGQAAAYELGRRNGRRVLAAVRTRPKLGRDLDAAAEQFARRGAWLVLASRWVGALRAVVPLLAGAAGMPRRRFHPVQTLGGLAWVGIVVALGRLMGTGVDGAHGWLLWTTIVVAAAVTGGTYAAWRRMVGRPLPRTVLWGSAGVAFGIGAAAILLRVIGVDAVRAVVASVDPRLVPLVLAVQIASTVTLTQVYRTTYASQGGRLGFRDALTVCLGAFSLTQLLPGGGAAGGVFVVQRLRRHGADPMRAVTTVLLLGLVTMGTLGIALSVATTVTALGSKDYAWHALASAAVTLVILAALVLLRRLADNDRLRASLAARLGRLRWRGRLVATEWTASLQRQQGFLEHPRTLLRPAGWSAVNWTLDVTVLALVLLAVDARAPLIGVLVAFAVANLLNSLPLTPGGIGVVEAGLAGTLIGFGADPVATSVGVLAYRAIAYWFPVLLAAPVLASGLRRGSRIVEVAA